jgi:hypothetical protein
MQMRRFVMVWCCGGGGGEGGRCLESMVGNASCAMGVKVGLVEIDGRAGVTISVPPN